MNYSIDLTITKKDLFNALFVSIISLLALISLFYLKMVGFIIFYLFVIISLIRKKYSLEIPIIIVLLVSTNVFEFGSVEQLPIIRLGAGLTFNFLDIIVTTYLFFLANRIINLKKTPSSWIIKFCLTISIIYVVIGMLLTFNPRLAGMNYLRTLIYIGFYFIFYLYFEDPNKIKRLLLIISFWVLIATAIQIVEFFQNYRFEIPGIKPFSSFYFTEGEKIFTAGQERIYLWSRVTGFIFIITAISLSIYLQNRTNFFVIVFLTTLLSFAIALSRIWFLGVLLIILTILLFNSMKAKFLFFIPATLLLLLFVFFQNIAFKATGIDFIESFMRRAESAATLGKTYGEMDTFTIRVLMFRDSFEKFLESPLWGSGFGSDVWNRYYSVDLGMINRLVFFGLLGTLPILFFVFSYSLKLVNIIRFKIETNKRIILLAVLAVLVGHFPLYLWQIDFWGSNYIFLIVMLLAMGDRILNSMRVS